MFDRSRRGRRLIRIGALVRHNLGLLVREPGPLVSRIVVPLLLMSLMAPLYRAAMPDGGTAAAVTGVGVTFSLLALSIVGTSILSERTWHTWDRLRATAAHPAELLAGKAVPAVAVLAVQQAALFTYGSWILGLRIAHPALLATAAGAWILALLGLGAAIGTLAPSHGALSAACDLGSVLTTCLGGALVPLAVLPGWARAVAPVSPGYWAVTAMRAALSGEPGTTLRHGAVLVGLGLAAGALACWRISRGWGRSRLL